MEIQKTIELNTLIDFYGDLLTDKQKDYLNLYYQQDFSLGEISQNFKVSRQAVYDNIRRSEKLLAEYEGKLHLVENFSKRDQQIQELIRYVKNKHGDDKTLLKLVEDLYREEN